MEEKIKHVKQMLEQMQDNLNEISQIEENLDSIDKLKGDESFYASIANGIMIEGKLNTDKTLKINVGNGTMVKKTIPETKNLLNKQREEIEKAMSQAKKELERLNKNV